MNPEDYAPVSREEMDLPERFIGGEPWAGGHVGEILVDGGFVGGGRESPVDDDEVAVEVDRGSPPALETAAVADHEATEPGVLQEERVPDQRFHGVDVERLLDSEDAVDHLVHLWPQEQPPRRG